MYSLTIILILILVLTLTHTRTRTHIHLHAHTHTLTLTLTLSHVRPSDHHWLVECVQVRMVAVLTLLSRRLPTRLRTNKDRSRWAHHYG